MPRDKLKNNANVNGWYNHYQARKKPTIRRNKAPQNGAISMAELQPQVEEDTPAIENESLDHQEDQQKYQQDSGYLRSIPSETVDDEDLYKLIPEIADEEDLIAAKNRMGRLVKHKTLLEKLPDKGAKIQEMFERVVNALEKKLNAKAPGFYKNVETKKTKAKKK